MTAPKQQSARPASPVQEVITTDESQLNLTVTSDVEGASSQVAFTQSGDEPSEQACCWRGCKKVSKNAGGGEIKGCSKVGCDRAVHAACAAAILSLFGASDTFNKTACGKRCYNALTKQTPPPTMQSNKRVLWHNDGPTPDVSSISVLMDWLTDGNNYSRYRGGDSQTGETKATIAGEVKVKIAAAGIATERTIKDITNKISSLETLFRNAEDWRNCTGQGVAYDEPTIRDALLRRCAFYFQLRNIMINRDSTQPQLLSTDEAVNKDDTENDSSNSSEAEPSKPPSVSRGISSAKRTSSTPISIAEKQSKRQRKRSDAEINPLMKFKEDQLAQNRELQLMELEVRKRQVQLHEQEVVVRQQQMENDSLAVNARVQEATAQAAKLYQETEHWRQQRKINLLRERNKLKNEGVAMDDIDSLLPLSTDF
ncbi:hypothetical protein DVH05_012398 [Phytophthora capsici]|nr:hypothetical protein DVH05_012398 [Phytophthora capsici]